MHAAKAMDAAVCIDCGAGVMSCRKMRAAPCGTALH